MILAIGLLLFNIRNDLRDFIDIFLLYFDCTLYCWWFASFYLFIPILSWSFNILDDARFYWSNPIHHRKWFAWFYLSILILSWNFIIVNDLQGSLLMYCYSGKFFYFFYLFFYRCYSCYLSFKYLEGFSIVGALIFSILLMFFYAFFHFDNIDNHVVYHK